MYHAHPACGEGKSLAHGRLNLRISLSSLFFTAAVWTLFVVPSPSYACSSKEGSNTDWEQLRRDESRELRRGTKRVSGILVIDKRTGDDTFDYVAILHSRSGKRSYALKFNEVGIIGCLGPFRPRKNASGAFYISSKRPGGYHELIDWDGEELPELDSLIKE